MLTKTIPQHPQFSQLRELPLLLVPGDVWGFLSSSAAPESFAELARRLGDATRLAAYAAFLGMTEEKQLELVSWGGVFFFSRDKNCEKSSIMGIYQTAQLR